MFGIKRNTSGSHHDIVTLHLGLLVGQFVILHLQAEANRQKEQACDVKRCGQRSMCLWRSLIFRSALPVILGLQELELVFDPVARFCHRELEPGLAGLMRRLRKPRSFSFMQSVTESSDTSRLHPATVTQTIRPIFAIRLLCSGYVSDTRRVMWLMEITAAGVNNTFHASWFLGKLYFICGLSRGLSKLPVRSPGARPAGRFLAGGNSCHHSTAFSVTQTGHCV